MKIPGRIGKHNHRSTWAIIAVMAVILIMGLTPAYGSSGKEATHGSEEVSHGAEEGAHGDAEGGHGEHAASKPWVMTDTAKVLNFSILAIGLFLVLRKPVSQALNDRIKGIKEELEELEGRKAEVEKQLNEYNTKLATLDEEADQVIAEYVRQGEEAKARILKEAESAADKLEEQAKKNIENEFKQAKEQLQAEIVEKALVKAEEMVKEKISPEDQERLVDEYLAKVVA
jgi:F-type H+-transporting ATPase subunit b